LLTNTQNYALKMKTFLSKITVLVTCDKRLHDI